MRGWQLNELWGTIDKHVDDCDGEGYGIRKDEIAVGHLEHGEAVCHSKRYPQQQQCHEICQ